MKIKIGLSNRHVHLTNEDVEILFGKGYKLTPRNYLYQPGQFATEETVTLKTNKNIKRNIKTINFTYLLAGAMITSAREIRTQ